MAIMRYFYTSGVAKRTTLLIPLRQGYRRSCEARRPFTQLPKALTADHDARSEVWYRGPAKLCFGFGVNSDHLIDYALKHDLVDPSKLREGTPLDIGRARFWAIEAVVDYLQYISEASKLHIGFPLSTEYEYMIYLYSNYSKEDEEMDEEDEKEILDNLRRELDIPEDVPAMWFLHAYN